MSQVVVDSSTLILLSKCSLLQKFCDVFKVITTETVKNEVASSDLVQKYPDAALLADLISKEVIQVFSLHPLDKKLLPISLHQGEEEALFLSVKLGNVLFATDDGKAIKAARFLRIPFIITPKIVVQLYQFQEIPLKKARQALEKLGKIGRYPPEILSEALLKLLEDTHGKTNHHQDT